MVSTRLKRLTASLIHKLLQLQSQLEEQCLPLNKPDKTLVDNLNNKPTWTIYFLFDYLLNYRFSKTFHDPLLLFLFMLCNQGVQVIKSFLIQQYLALSG